jgi:hypothetical protein
MDSQIHRIPARGYGTVVLELGVDGVSRLGKATPFVAPSE